MKQGFRAWMGSLAILLGVWLASTAQAAPLLWVVEDGNSKLYLAGSLHL